MAAITDKFVDGGQLRRSNNNDNKYKQKYKYEISTAPLTPIVTSGALQNTQFSNAAAKRNVFSSFLNVSMSDCFRRSEGREFQAEGPANEKALSPSFSFV